MINDSGLPPTPSPGIRGNGSKTRSMANASMGVVNQQMPGVMQQSPEMRGGNYTQYSNNNRT